MECLEMREGYHHGLSLSERGCRGAYLRCLPLVAGEVKEEEKIPFNIYGIGSLKRSSGRLRRMK